MRFSCLQENLHKGLTQAGHLASKNASLPILNNVLVSCANGLITLSATNLEVGISTVIRGRVEEDGRLTVPGKTFSDYVSLVSDSKIEAESVGADVKISTKNAHSTIKGQSADEFPLIPLVEKKNPYSVKARDLKQAISQIVYAVAQDESRPEISGVYMKVADDALTVVATDSYRLAEKTIKLTKPNTQAVEAIIPTRTIQEVSRVMSDEADSLEIYFSENQVLFVCEGVEVVSRIIEGRYPDYKQIIPQQYNTTATVRADAFIKAVKGAALFSKTGINDINLRFDSATGKIIVTSANAQLGENTTELDAEITGEANEVVFNHRYLIDGLTNAVGAEVVLELIDGSNPSALRAKDSRDFLYIIMPIKQ
jgi:DNA polymerase-3 subunit beta